MAFNFLGPLMLGLLIASILGVIVGGLKKNEKVLKASMAILGVIIIAYIVLSIFFE